MRKWVIAGLFVAAYGHAMWAFLYGPMVLAIIAAAFTAAGVVAVTMTELPEAERERLLSAIRREEDDQHCVCGHIRENHPVSPFRAEGRPGACMASGCSCSAFRRKD